jgi:hypothetical protein
MNWLFRKLFKKKEDNLFFQLQNEILLLRWESIKK